MDQQSESPTDEVNLPGFLPRSPGHLMSLPVKFKWETTRRHPTYNIWWKPARAFHQMSEELDDLEHHFAYLAHYFIRAIGVSGEPIEPKINFEDIDNDSLNAPWLSGAIQSMSFRTMASLLLETAPKPVLQYLSVNLFEAAKADEPDQLPARFLAIDDLNRAQVSDLDKYPDAPFVAINPTASMKQATKDLSELMKSWKVKANVGDLRDRSAKYAQYLQVWDLREGWRDGIYQRENELHLKQISKNLKLNISTVNNRYRSAFELITGYQYTPERWCFAMSPIKLTALLQASGATLGPGPVSARRPLKSPTPADVPVSRLTTVVDYAQGGQGILQSALASTTAGYHELVSDIMERIKGGKSSEQIVQELELSDEFVAAIDEMRTRQEEFS